MPNGIQHRVCSQCNTYRACHPWGDSAEWYCFPCFTQWEVCETSRDLKRVLFRSNLPGAASEAVGSATQQVLQDMTILPRVIEFLETGLEDLHWDVD